MAKHEEPDAPREKRRFKEFLDLGDPSGPEEPSGTQPVPRRPANPDPWANEPMPPEPDPWPSYQQGNADPEPFELEPDSPGLAEPELAEPELEEPEVHYREPYRPEPRAHAAYETAPSGVRRLVTVTGAVVAALAILAVTGLLLEHAWFLIFIAVIAALFYYAGFIARGFAFQRHSQLGFAIVVALFCVTAYIGWRDRRTAQGLAAVITPVPEIVDVARLPASGEVEAALALSATLEAIDGALSRQAAGHGPDTAERARWARLADEERHRYWVVQTDLTIPQVMEFYARPENLAGWTVVAERREGLLSLRRGGEELLIMASEGSPHARSKIGYLYIGVEQDR